MSANRSERFANLDEGDQTLLNRLDGGLRYSDDEAESLVVPQELLNVGETKAPPVGDLMAADYLQGVEEEELIRIYGQEAYLLFQASLQNGSDADSMLDGGPYAA